MGVSMSGAWTLALNGVAAEGIAQSSEHFF